METRKVYLFHKSGAFFIGLVRPQLEELIFYSNMSAVAKFAQLCSFIAPLCLSLLELMAPEQLGETRHGTTAAAPDDAGTRRNGQATGHCPASKGGSWDRCCNSWNRRCNGESDHLMAGDEQLASKTSLGFPKNGRLKPICFKQV